MKALMLILILSILTFSCNRVKLQKSLMEEREVGGDQSAIIGRWYSVFDNQGYCSTLPEDKQIDVDGETLKSVVTFYDLTSEYVKVGQEYFVNDDCSGESFYKNLQTDNIESDVFYQMEIEQELIQGDDFPSEFYVQKYTRTSILKDQSIQVITGYNLLLLDSNQIASISLGDGYSEEMTWNELRDLVTQANALVFNNPFSSESGWQIFTKTPTLDE